MVVVVVVACTVCKSSRLIEWMILISGTRLQHYSRVAMLLYAMEKLPPTTCTVQHTKSIKYPFPLFRAHPYWPTSPYQAPQYDQHARAGSTAQAARIFC